MSKLHTTIEWVTANWAWLSPIVLGILANLYNGMSKHPEVQTLIKDIIDKLSVVTHRDSPGTFKAPFRKSKAPTNGKLQMEGR